MYKKIVKKQKNEKIKEGHAGQAARSLGATARQTGFSHLTAGTRGAQDVTGPCHPNFPRSSFF
jgi:hypothetical protein